MKKLVSIMLATVILAASAAISLPFSAFAESYEYTWEKVQTCEGDANQDNLLNSKDVLLYRRFLAGIVQKFAISSIYSDVNLDGFCNSKDILLIRKALAGQIKLNSLEQYNDVTAKKSKFVYVKNGIEYSVITSLNAIYSSLTGIHFTSKPAMIDVTVTAKNVSGKDISLQSTNSYVLSDSDETQNDCFLISFCYSNFTDYSPQIKSNTISETNPDTSVITQADAADNSYTGWQKTYSKILPQAPVTILHDGESVSYSDVYNTANVTASYADNVSICANLNMNINGAVLRDSVHFPIDFKIIACA